MDKRDKREGRDWLVQIVKSYISCTTLFFFRISTRKETKISREENKTERISVDISKLLGVWVFYSSRNKSLPRTQISNPNIRRRYCKKHIVI